MKKFVTFVLLYLLLFSLTACGTAKNISCQYCNATNTAGSKFCSSCGQDLLNAEAEAEVLTEETSNYDNSIDSSSIDSVIEQTKNNIQPYLDVMGADITNGNPPVSQEFIDNLSSVRIMEYVGSVEHGYNIYGEKTYIELMTWTTNNATTNNEFYEFVELMNEYFKQDAILASYDHIDDEIWGWEDPSGQYSIITYYDDQTIYLQWDVRLDFEDEEILERAVLSTDSNYQTQTKSCIECGQTASHTFTNPFSGEIEDYCYTHYQEIIDVMSMMESDVGNSSYSKHTCEECNKEGTNSIIGISGKTEYYCSTHYSELMEFLEMLN